MKLCSITGSRKRISLAASAVAGSLSLVAGSASAQQYSYTQLDTLTPYQIVSSEGQCIEALPPGPDGRWVAQPKPCSTSRLQTFYLLNPGTVTDFVPQTQGGEGDDAVSNANAQIVLATDLDKPQRWALLPRRRPIRRS